MAKELLSNTAIKTLSHACMLAANRILLGRVLMKTSMNEKEKHWVINGNKSDDFWRIDRSADFKGPWLGTRTPSQRQMESCLNT